jgi:hypothetical protein
MHCVELSHQLDRLRRDVRQLIVQLVQKTLALGEIGLAAEITLQLV